YADFSSAVGDASLHIARAHYDATLRLAITYEDTFAQNHSKDEERHALLHEFVHELQHAFSSTGALPKVTWFNEGLADYRASCTNMADSLQQPPLLPDHVLLLANVYVRPNLKPLALPLEQLIAAASYADIVKLASARAGPVDAHLALEVFYAQAEMFTRFLHEGAAAKYRAGYQRYLQAALRGETGVAAFAAAIGDGKPVDLKTVELDWLTWLTGVLRQRGDGRYPDLAREVQADGSVTMPLPPPVDFDPATLAWKAEEFAERLAACRRLCAHGEYENAQTMLQAAAVLATAAEQQLATREQERIQLLITLREFVLADLDKNKGWLDVKLDGKPQKGRFVRREADAVVLLANKQEQRLPLSALDPEFLLHEGTRLKQFDGLLRWQEAWLRWLGGARLATLQKLLAGEFSKIVVLRQDLVTDLSGDHGLAAAALLELQRLRPPPEPAAARSVLERLQQLLRQQGSHALLQSRKDAIDRLARALAERAFTADSAEALGLEGVVERLADGRVTVSYPRPADVLGADFTLQQGDQVATGLAMPRLVYDGPPQLQTVDGKCQMIGAGLFRWAAPLGGEAEFEIGFELVGRGSNFGLVVNADDTGLVFVQPDGSVAIIDRSSGIDENVGTPAQLFIGKAHRLRIHCDGQKRLQVWLDGARTADLPNIGRRTRGDFGLLVHASEPVKVQSLKLTARIAPVDPLPLREKFVQGVLGKLWP
ncbi:MAG TPA: hypothetical protein VK348_06565, partial [Planctomycetota bacterium]|nr:hypothetical protein [Planctomycetota bacterium]